MFKKKKCNFFLLFLGITLIFFINPVNAQIINGDFGTDLSGWIKNENYGGYAVWSNGTVKVVDGTMQVAWTGIGQEVDITDYTMISLDYKMSGCGECRAWVNVGSKYLQTKVWEGSCNANWETVHIPLLKTGLQELWFQVYRYDSGGPCNLYFDNIILRTGECTINYNPNILVTNTKPFNLSYFLNSAYEGQYCEIYSYTGTDIGNETHPNIIWQKGFEGYVNQASGNFITSDYFHSYHWPDLNVSYGVGLFTAAGATSGIRFPDIESDPNYLAHDQIYVHYNYSYPTPTPQPTPNATPTATPTGTPTPGPTATAQPDPEPNNESLNTSFTGGYYGFVNDTVDGFFIPVYNFTDYIAQPLTMLNQTLDNFTVEMNKSFNNASGSLGISTNILFLIMVGFPQKLINVMTYYLAWVIILLIFKGQT